MPLSGVHNQSAEHATRPAARGGRILVADDDPWIRGFLQTVLQGEGYEVITAADGQQAVDRAAESAPALVLLDLAMPVMNGWQVQEQLHRSGLPAPIVFMSAGYDVRREAEAHHAAGYLPKPFEVDDLLNVVARLIVNTSAEQEHGTHS